MNKTIVLKITKEELIEAINDYFCTEFPELETDISHPMTGKNYIQFSYTWSE